MTYRAGTGLGGNGQVSVNSLRIGALGAARITSAAVIDPAQEVPGAVVTAVASRDPGRAREFAATYGIPVVHECYEALIADPGIDAVYNALPNSLHAPWTLRAIEAGKHVLCEKPITANAAEAEAVADAAESCGVVVMEAFHYLYHPLAWRMREICQGPAGARPAGGELGAIRHIETSVSFPISDPSDIRFRYGLAGGATMDAGCYAISCLRLLGPGEPEVVSAEAELQSPGVDAAMTAGLFFPGGATGRFEVSLQSDQPFTADVQVTGEAGEMRVTNFTAPHVRHQLLVRDGEIREEHVPGDATYTCQLRAFTAAVLHGEPYPTTAGDAVRNMRLIDEVYRAAGLRPRGM
jgi:predicted dehydrogenase